MYSLIVKLALLAWSLMMAFSPSVMRTSIRNVAPCARVDLAIPLSFAVGSRGVALSKDAQPFLRVAEGGLEKWWWLDETPQGFCPDSAYLAIQCLAIQFFALNPVTVRFSVQNQFTVSML
jgi:hypothetical protein